jgi:hypothetical protein
MQSEPLNFVISNSAYLLEELAFFNCSYAVNCTALYGMMRRQLIPFPLMNPRKPSSIHILRKLWNTPLYFCSEFCDWTCLAVIMRKKSASLMQRGSTCSLDDLDSFQGAYNCSRCCTGATASYKIRDLQWKEVLFLALFQISRSHSEMMSDSGDTMKLRSGCGKDVEDLYKKKTGTVVAVEYVESGKIKILRYSVQTTTTASAHYKPPPGHMAWTALVGPQTTHKINHLKDNQVSNSFMRHDR